MKYLPYVTVLWIEAVPGIVPSLRGFQVNGEQNSKQIRAAICSLGKYKFLLGREVRREGVSIHKAILPDLDPNTILKL